MPPSIDQIDTLRQANRVENACTVIGWLVAVTFALMLSLYIAGADQARRMTFVPVMVLFLAWVAGSIWERVLRDRAHVPSPSDGCCGCGADECDVIVSPNSRGQGEGYCWPCIDAWPDDVPPVADQGFYVLSGRERGEVKP